jgi:hypothetical protein
MPLGSVPHVIVLVEGRSDAAAVEVLLRARGLDGDGRVEIVSMDGVTNAARELGRTREAYPGAVVVGLYDAAEARFVVGALRRAGIELDGVADLAAHGFFVCDADLEDELIRAVGEVGVEEALVELGDLDRFRTFQHQPEWRGRSLTDQFHRFAGSGSGRKAALARALALRLDRVSTPAPLAALLDRIDQAVVPRTLP